MTMLNEECAKTNAGNINLPYFSGSFLANLICFALKYIADGRKRNMLSIGTQKNKDRNRAIQTQV